MMETHRVIIKYNESENLWFIEDEQMGYKHDLLTFDTQVIDELASVLENPKEDGCCLFASEKERQNCFRFSWIRSEPSGEVYISDQTGEKLCLSREFMRLWEETPKALYLEAFYF
jgi:hypothetical protein